MWGTPEARLSQQRVNIFVSIFFPRPQVFRQKCKISIIAMGLSDAVYVCVCLSVTIVRKGHTLAKIKNVKRRLKIVTFAIERYNCANYTQ